MEISGVKDDNNTQKTEHIHNNGKVFTNKQHKSDKSLKSRSGLPKKSRNICMHCKCSFPTKYIWPDRLTVREQVQSYLNDKFCIWEKGKCTGKYGGNIGYSYMNVFIVPMGKYTYLERWGFSLSRKI